MTMKTLRFKIWLFNLGVLMMFLSFQSYSQTIARQSISSYGSTSSVDGQTYSQTIGQAYNTKNQENVRVTQGFLQPVSYKIEKVNQDRDELDISVYPNPAHHSVFLKTTKVLKEAFISISDLNGKLIYNQQIQNVKEHVIDCSLWSTGIYIIKIQDDQNHQSVNKLIISN